MVGLVWPSIRSFTMVSALLSPTPQIFTVVELRAWEFREAR